MAAQETLQDRARLLRIVVDRFDTASLVDPALARTLFSELRQVVVAAGADDEDIRFLAEHLVRWVVDTDGMWAEEARQERIRLVAELFARRPIAVDVINGQASVRVADE